MNHTPWFLTNQPQYNFAARLTQSTSLALDRNSFPPATVFGLKSAPNPIQGNATEEAEEEVFVNSKLIKFDHLSKYFESPITEVAKKFGVCTTVLKKVCRKNGIPRWPFRKLKSLDKKIAALEACIQSNPDEAPHLQAEISILRNRKKRIVENPACLALNKTPAHHVPSEQSNVSESKSEDENDSHDVIDGSKLLLNLTPTIQEHKKQPLTFLSQPKPVVEEPIQFRNVNPHLNSIYSPSLNYSPLPQYPGVNPLPSRNYPQTSFVQAQEIFEKLSVETIQRNLFDSANASAMLPFYGKTKIALSPPANLPAQLFTPRSFFTQEEMTPPHVNWRSSEKDKSNTSLRGFSSWPDSSEVVVESTSSGEEKPKVLYFSPQPDGVSLPQLGKRGRTEEEDESSRQTKRLRTEANESSQDPLDGNFSLDANLQSRTLPMSSSDEKKATIPNPPMFPPFQPM